MTRAPVPRPAASGKWPRYSTLSDTIMSWRPSWAPVLPARRRTKMARRGSAARTRPARSPRRVRFSGGMVAATDRGGEDCGRLPSGPPAPVWWLTMEWIVRPTALLRRSAARYGEPFTLRTAWADAPMVLVWSPENVRRVFTAGSGELRGGGSAVLEPFAGPSSLLVLDGEEHLRARRLQLPAFHGDRMRSYAPLVAKLAADELDAWPRGRELRTHARMQALTL